MVLNVLAKMGLCQSYSTITKQIVLLAADAKAVLRDLVKKPCVPWALLYDNINYMIRVKHQSSTNHNAFNSSVVGNIVILDNCVSLRSEAHPQTSDEVFKKVMSSTIPRPTIESRRLCSSQDTLRRSRQPAHDLSVKRFLDRKDVFPDEDSDEHWCRCLRPSSL
jgi:hypothetical protein